MIRTGFVSLCDLNSFAKLIPNEILKILTTYLKSINKIISYYYNITEEFNNNIIINYGLSGTALYRISNELDNISLLFNKNLYCICLYPTLSKLVCNII